MNWVELKIWLEMSTGLDRDSLHIYAGVAVQLCVAVVLRRSLASPIPWLAAAVVALINEYFDYSSNSTTFDIHSKLYDEAVKDIWNTLLLPSVLLLVARFRPHWLTGKASRREKPYPTD